MKQTKYNYPVAPYKPVTEDYFGMQVTDHYRNLENLEDAEVQSWFKAQGAYAEQILENIPGRNALIEKMESIRKREGNKIFSVKVTRNNQCFFLKQQQGTEAAQVYYRKDKHSKDELLFDPKGYKPKMNKSYVISNISPSWEGQYLMIAIAHSGSEISEMIILDMTTRKILPQVITHCFTNIQWFPNSKGFAYVHRPVIDVNSSKLWKDTKLVRYYIGDDPKQLDVFFSKDSHPHMDIKSSDFVAVKLFDPSDKYIIGYVTRSTSSKYPETYYTKVDELTKGIPDWKSLLSAEDEARHGKLINDNYIYTTVKNAPNGQIRSIALGKELAKDSILLVDEKTNSIIGDFAVTSKGLYFTRIKNGVESKLYILQAGKEKNIPLDHSAGTIKLSSKGKRSSEIVITTSGWLNNETRYNLLNKQLVKANLSPLIHYPEFDDFIVKEVLVKSHDGEEVPLSIIHKKGIELNGQHPTLMRGYGSHNISLLPRFAPLSNLLWVALGGIYCEAHVRGGGEKGEAWFQAGRKTNKPNTWKDFIACTEYLIKENYTSPNKMSIRGGSSGGITIGRAMTARPDLYAVAISEVGGMNMLRAAENSPNPGPIIRDHGSSTDPTECKSLIEMDAYLQLQKGIKYPATLITAGMNDPRVSAWQPGKFAAKLQAYNVSNKPTIFWVNYESGHGFGNTASQEIKRWANIFSFIFWQIGHPDYQLK